MKRLLLIYLFSSIVFAQHNPVSESNSFVYNKYNYGNEFFNGTRLWQNKDGSVIFSPYATNIPLQITNTGSKQVFDKKLNIQGQIEAVFDMPNNIKYYCMVNKIVVYQNNMFIKTMVLHPSNLESYQFQLFENKIYFTVDDNLQKKRFLKYFDGNKIISVALPKKIKDDVAFSHFVQKKFYFFHFSKNDIDIYTIENNNFTFIKKYKFDSEGYGVKKVIDENNFVALHKNTKIIVENGIQFKTSTPLNCTDWQNAGYFLTKNQNEKKCYDATNNLELFNTTAGEIIANVACNKPTNSYYGTTGTDFLRIFPHIKKYPRLFNNSNSNTVFSLQQASNGNVWAGSYQGALSVIKNNNATVVQSKIKNFMYMNGGMPIKNKMIFLAENLNGVLLFEDLNHYKKIADSITCFYTYISKKNVLYLGAYGGNGLWHKDLKDIENIQKPWNKVGSKQGVNLVNILTICEDKFGNIWSARKGFSVYNPRTKFAKTWLIEKNEVGFGSMASLLDTKQTMWFGTIQGGLVFYDGKHETDYDMKNFVEIEHPLLQKNKKITFIHQWKNYLVLGATDKVLLFDLEQYYTNKKIIVRYLNPLEMNLTTTTEQNTVLTDNRDNSLWFSTSDNLYKVNLEKWLSLPTFAVKPAIIISKDSIENRFEANNKISFKPTESSFDIDISFQTKDNMPRYLNGVLLKKDEEVVFEAPNLQTKFQFKNLASGDYVFYVRICQQDGTVSQHQFPIHIHKFFWQQWWFWFLMSMFPLGFLWYYDKKKREVELQKKRLTQLNLTSLSNQFRPHFMLNALNSISSQLHDKPHAEKVITRLGDSINILYGFTQKNEFTHTFYNEWRLVENNIEIQRLMFIPELVVNNVGIDLIPTDYKMPVGIIQIPVENALLHGLRNKADKNCILDITITDDSKNFYIDIDDNGVGREKSNKMNNFMRNGNGLKTVLEMIKIINNSQKNAINFEIIDKDSASGTLVKIRLNKKIDFERIKL